MQWRVIEYSEQDAFMNMALDQSISEGVARGADPTIRFYGWKPSAVSIGYFQRLEHEVDPLACRQEGIDIVRRRTGGGAVFHDSYGEITYSVIAKETMFPKDIISSYKEICGWIIDSLSMLDLRCAFRPINDITLDGRKISGNAQTRRDGVLLQHGTILYSVDVERMFSVLRVPDEKMKGKLIQDVKASVTSIIAHRNVSRDDAYSALLEGFTRGKDCAFSSITEAESRRALELVHERYLLPEWNLMR